MDLRVDTQVLGATSRSLADLAAEMRLAVADRVDGRVAPGATNGSPSVREALSAAILDARRAVELVNTSADYLASTADSLAATSRAFDRVELTAGDP